LAVWLPETNKTCGVWHTMVLDFAASLPRNDFHPGMSNETVVVQGLAASRSFLAEMCDMDWLMMSITPSGISLLGVSKQELNMQEPLVLEGATKSHSIEANNLPGLPKVLLTLHAKDNDKETDWLWVCLDDHSLNWDHVKTLISMVRTRGARAVILFWASKSNDTAVVSYWVSWCNGREDDWKAKPAIVENAHCGGPIAKSTSLLVLAPAEVIALMGGFDDKDEMEAMDSYLDLPNTRWYSDYLQGWTLDALDNSDSDYYDPKVVASIDHYGSKMLVYGRDYVAPSLNAATVTEGGLHFLVPTADMGLKQSVRPVRDHELFALYGFPPEFAKTVVNLPRREKALLLLWSMPKHSIKPVISVVQLAEVQAADNRMLALAKEAGETPVVDSSVVPSFYCAPRQNEEAPFCFATSQVINRWTTIPCPTIEE
jgi:hypothetical protein